MAISRLLFSLLFLISNNFVARASGSAVAKTTYVVVGGGTAGLAVATRLSEDSANKVIVLEAGSDGFNNPNIANLSGPSIQALPRSSVDWNYTSLPLKYASNQTIAMTRGRVLGGSSAVNGALFTRPNKIDLDLWESAFGATGWNWDTISASIKMAEHFSATEGLTSTLPFHGTSGPICDSQRTPIGDVWGHGVIPAVLACNGTESVDQNGGDPSGIWYTPKAMFPNSTRSYSANSYYQPNAERTNLQVKLNVTVSRILWGQSQNGKAFATGVEYINTAGKKHTVSGDRVILSAGVFGTPQVLELSGVGNPEIINPLGISTVVNLPAVGENLSEQPTTKYLAPLASGITNSGLQLTLNFESPRTLLNASEWHTAHQLLKTKPPGLSDAAHKALKAMFMSDSVIVEFMGFPMPNNLLFLPILLHPCLAGPPTSSLRMQWRRQHSILPSRPKGDNKPLALVSNRLSISTYSPSCPTGAQVCHPAVSGSIPRGYRNRAWCRRHDRRQFQKFVKDAIGVAYHPLGTAAIGSVVDENLAVKGTTNVFVVDGSIIPLQPGSHPSSIIYGIGEKAAAMLKTSPLTYDV
ncbi:hypothetical protein B0H13DRAFT_2435621 [Mycena leptocephala]|nr:hypothetical protein B0H13DRAFT_2435621 [Mycena leptocephala]